MPGQNVMASQAQYVHVEHRACSWVYLEPCSSKPHVPKYKNFKSEDIILATTEERDDPRRLKSEEH